MGGGVGEAVRAVGSTLRGRESELHAMSEQVLAPMRRGSFPAHPEKVGRLYFRRMTLREAVLTHFNVPE